MELDDKRSPLPLQKEMNSVAGVPIRINTTIFLPKECLQPLLEGQLDIKLTQSKQVEAQPIYCGTCISYVKVQERDGSIRFLKDRTSITYAYNANESISNGFWNEGAKVHNNSSLLLPLTNESVFNDAIETNAGTDTMDIDDAAATGMCSVQFHQTRDRNKMQPHGGESDTYVKSNGFWNKGAEFFCDSSLLQSITSEPVCNEAIRTNGGTDTKGIHDKDKMPPPSGENFKFVKSNEAEVYHDSSFLQYSTSELDFNDTIGTNIGTNTNIDDTAATALWSLQYDPFCDKIKLQPPGGESVTSIKSDRAVSSSGGSIRKNDKLLKPCHSSINSQVGVAEQSKAASTSVSRSLHMMFPRDYNPPSREELIKKFCRFGSVDHLKTKFYFYGRSAQVVFYDSNDAVVAYNYAKRRRLFFGQANVRYWLNPLEQERRGTVERVGPITKSCLKRSNPPINEVK